MSVCEQHKIELIDDLCLFCLEYSSNENLIGIIASLGKRLQILDAGLLHISHQFCTTFPREKSQASMHSPCAQTEMCITEYCLPCYAAAIKEKEKKA